MRWTMRIAAWCVGVVLGTVAGAQPAPGESGAGRRPNVIFILADDLGYGDVGAFFQNQRKQAGRPAHSTPQLDKMAAEGVRLTRHYCPAPVCAPSRASLMLGVHQGHANVRDNQFDKALENNHTLATVLKQAGYATAAVGKWGLQGGALAGAEGEEVPKGPAGAPARRAAREQARADAKPPVWPAHPLKRGFDSYYGYMRHADGHEHYPKEGVYRGKKEVWENRTEVSAGLDKCYTTDLFAARAKQWVIDQKKASPDQPFFLYLAFDTPHAVCELPTMAYPAGGGLSGGLKWHGKPGAMINTAGGTVDSFVHPDYAVATYDHDGDPKTPAVAWPDVYKRYATSVRRIDDAVGDLIQLLKDLKADENTIVVFTSDNGPSVESYLPEKFSPQFFGGFAAMDGIKRDVWEGGLRVPAIVRWPGVVKAVSGGREVGLASGFPDWMATFAAAAGVPAPARCDGVSLLPALSGVGEQRPPRVYVEYFQDGKTPPMAEFEAGRRGRVRKQMQALAIGDLTGVRYDVKSAADDFEIYDAIKDPKQTMNLAKAPGGADLQKQFKETALRVRRPGGGVKRPYDEEPIPAIGAAVADLKPGVPWRAYAAEFPWVPQTEGLKATGTGRIERPGLAVAAMGDAVAFDGYLEAPADGRYTIFLSADGGAVLRVHEATVIDADFGYVGGTEASGEVVLKAGRHPFTLAYARRPKSKGPSVLKLEWTGPGIARQEIPAGAFSAGEAGPK